MTSCILIVDDECNQRRALAIGLRLEGFDIVEAADGFEALDRVSERAIDLAIIDVMMPRMNGLDLARRLGATHPAIPLVLTSAYHLSQRQIERAGIPAIAFVPKPYSLDDLTRFLRDRLPAPVRVATS